MVLIQWFPFGGFNYYLLGDSNWRYMDKRGWGIGGKVGVTLWWLCAGDIGGWVKIIGHDCTFIH